MKTALIVFASMLLSFTHAQVSLAVPTIYMQSATINGASNVVTVSRVPVQNAAGVITYKDISMGFIVDTLGNVTFNNAALRIVASPLLNVGAFKQGTYRGYKACSSGDCLGYTFKVGAPGVGTGGRISGSISRITGGARDVFNASWTSGPIAGHPYQAKLIAARITATTYNWGIVGDTGERYYAGLNWDPGHIIGTIQTGNQLTICNFGTDNKADSELTFTLCPTANPC